MGIVLLERLRSDSSLVTNETGVSQKKWDFARETAASLYVAMFLGETQQTDKCMDCSQASRPAALLPASLFVQDT